jgi:hypothetical protein
MAAIPRRCDDPLRSVFIYALLDPRDGAVRYVGKSARLDERFQQHLHKKSTNPHKDAWISQLRGLGMIPHLVLLEECLQCRWRQCERFWEVWFRNQGCRLININECGYGPNPACMTEEFRAKARENWRSNVKMQERWREDVQRRWQDPEYRERQIEALKRRWEDPAFREKMIALHQGKIVSEETRQLRSRWWEGRKEQVRNGEVAKLPGGGKPNVWEGFIDPEGNPIPPIRDLKAFCKERGLLPPNMAAVYRGDRGHCHGYRNIRPEAVERCAARAAARKPPPPPRPPRKGSAEARAWSQRVLGIRWARYRAMKAAQNPQGRLDL